MCGADGEARGGGRPTAPRTRVSPSRLLVARPPSATTAPRGPRRAEVDQGLHRIRGPLEHRLHRSVAAVAHPAGNAAPQRLPPRVSRKNTPCTLARDHHALAHPAHSSTMPGRCPPSPPGASTPSMAACSTSCSVPPTTSAGCPPAPSRAPRSPRTSCSAARTRPRQHAEMVSVYEENRGQRPLPRARPPPPLPGLRARLEHQRPARARSSPSAPSTGAGASTRAVIRFYQQNDIPIADMITAGSLRGRRLHDRRARRGRHRHRRGAHPGAGRAPGGRAGSRAMAGRCASSASRPTSSTSTCSPACSARSSRRSASSRPRTAS